MPSARLQVTQTGSGWYTCRSCCHPQAPLQAGEMGCGGRVLHTDTSWSHPTGKTPLQRRPWAPGVGQEPAVCPEQADGMGCTSRVTEVILPFPHTGAVPSVRHTHTQLGVQLKATEGFRDCSTSLTRKGWGSRDCLGTRKLRETLINTYHHLKWGAQKMEPGSHQGCPVTGQEGMAHTGTRELPSEHKNTQVLWGWLRTAELAQGDWVSFLGNPKPSGHRSGQQGLAGMAGAEGMDLQRSLPTSTSLGFCK